jgi:cyanophycinase-like exopeptidase
MKLYLFGGAELELNQAQTLKDLIKQTITDLHPKSVLHVPFARLHPTEEVFKEGWFKEMMKDTGIEIIDARNQFDLDKANNPLIFINGGHGKIDLIEGVNQPKIKDLILNADYIVSESSGSALMAELMREGKAGSNLIRGLGILKNTIIEPHYSERHSEKLLKEEMLQSKIKYGIGIDCVTAMVVDPAEFPNHWTKLGMGNVCLETA